MALFKIHFLTLENSGDGYEFVNSEIQRTLGGQGMPDSLAVDVTFESKVAGTTLSPSHVATRKAVTFTRIPTIILAAVNSNRSFCHVPLTETPTTILGSLTPPHPF